MKIKNVEHLVVEAQATPAFEDVIVEFEVPDTYTSGWFLGIPLELGESLPTLTPGTYKVVKVP